MNIRAKAFPKGTVIFPKIGAAIATNKKKILTCESTFDNNVMGIVPGDQIDSAFLYALMQFINLSIWASDSQPPSMRKSVVESHKIPVPPLEVQKEIVAEIEGYQKVIDGARAVLDNYRPHIAIDPEWELSLIGDIVEFISGLTVSIPEVEKEGGTPILAINNVTEDGNITLQGLRHIQPPSKTLNYVRKGDSLFNWRNGSKHLVGKTARFDLDGKFLFASFLLGIRPNTERVSSSYLWHMLNIYRREGKYMQFMRQNVNGLFRACKKYCVKRLKGQY